MSGFKLWPLTFPVSSTVPEDLESIKKKVLGQHKTEQNYSKVDSLTCAWMNVNSKVMSRNHWEAVRSPTLRKRIELALQIFYTPEFLNSINKIKLQAAWLNRGTSCHTLNPETAQKMKLLTLGIILLETCGRILPLNADVAPCTDPRHWLSSAKIGRQTCLWVTWGSSDEGFCPGTLWWPCLAFTGLCCTPRLTFLTQSFSFCLFLT